MPNAQVVGTDGHVPVYNPNSRWQSWSLSEIFTGSIGLGKYVPNINDYVEDTSSGITYIVDGLDPITLIPTLRVITRQNNISGPDSNDILFGVDKVDSSDTYKVYVDKNVTPYRLAVDKRLYIAGSDSAYVKIFRSTNIGALGNVISQVFDNSGNFTSENVQLELANINGYTNYNTKTVPVCNTNADLEDNEIVSVVVYTSSGSVVYKRQMQVVNTAFVRPLNSSQKYIVGIDIETPLKSLTVSDLISLPINLTLSDALETMKAVVHYSDGTLSRSNIDGYKFSIDGLNQIVPLEIDFDLNVTLRYRLDPNEQSYSTTINGQSITKPYRIRTINPNNSLGFKLYVFPEWRDASNGYRLRYFLYNLERKLSIEVTNYVTMVSTGGALDPFGYGLSQTKTVRINPRNISYAYPDFNYQQTYVVSLMGPPEHGLTPWTVQHEKSISLPTYGQNLEANIINNNMLSISSNISNYQDWLTAVYNNGSPLIDPISEVTSPLPTHFSLTIGNITIERLITAWNLNNDFGQTLTSYAGKNVYIKFFKRMANTDIQLSISAMTIK
jgi:hypothetical protein